MYKNVYNPSDLIILTVVDGYIIKIEGGIRAKIMEEFLKDQSRFDIAKGRKSNVAYRLAELAWGINKGAKNPEEIDATGSQVISVLITEKAAGVPHIAIGSLPDRTDKEIVLTESDTHIDNGLRNPKLRIEGKNTDGQTILLTSKLDGEKGKIDEIIEKY